MSTYPQFGYACTAAGSQTTSARNTELSTLAKARSGPSSMTGSGDDGGGVSPGYSSNSCSSCENGRSLVNDPVTGLPVCSCQYASATRLAGLSTYPRLTTTAVGVYGAPYPSTDQNPYPSIDSTFYSPLGTPYGIKEGIGGADVSTWTSGGLQTTPAYYHYDSTMAAYGYGTGYDLAARRKNATRESTTTLKAWLNEHKKNPYPTKGEKIMLAIITKMTLTQVSTWFANARRRLKKENKMTWEPKNRTDDDDDDDETMMSNYEEKDDGSVENDRIKDNQTSTYDCTMSIKSEHDNLRELDDENDFEDSDEDKCKRKLLLDHCLQPLPINCQHHPHQHDETQYMKDQLVKFNKLVPPNLVVNAPSKPKIWSLADTAACKTPPPMHTQQPATWSTASTSAATNPTYIITTQDRFISSDGSNSTGDGYSSRYSNYYTAGNGPLGGHTDFLNSKTYASSQTSLQRSPSTTNGYSISEQQPVTHYTNKCDYSQLSSRQCEIKHGGGVVKYAQQFRMQSQSASQFTNHQNTATVPQLPGKEIASESFYKKSESSNGTSAATI